jgi:hypothetical protein
MYRREGGREGGRKGRREGAKKTYVALVGLGAHIALDVVNQHLQGQQIRLLAQLEPCRKEQEREKKREKLVVTF